MALPNSEMWGRQATSGALFLKKVTRSEEVIISFGPKAFVLASREDAEFSDTLVWAASFARIGATRWVELERLNRLPPRSILMWSRYAASMPSQAISVLEAHKESDRLAILNRDESPLPAGLITCVQLEWTNPADVWWQYRVLHGVPAGLTDRPLGEQWPRR